ncbi:substrate-binding periplasmic protein [Roseibium sp.]|uniref:substrate-binding periplasmic protein n=1 Tax=Roseibium sp. TaxID=1936156 RepID=UPI003D0B448D
MAIRSWLWVALLVVAIFPIGLPTLGHPAGSVIILATDYPPFDIAEPEDDRLGFDHEVAVEAFKRKGITAEVVYVPWSRAVSETEAGNYPGLLTCAHTVERAEHFLFSAPISQEAYGVFYRTGHPVENIRSIADLRGQRVASVLEYAPNAEMERQGAELVNIATDTAGFKMLELGRVDYFHTGQAAGQHLKKKLGYRNEFGFRSFVVWDYFLCFSRKHPASEELRQAFNEGLAEIRADGTYEGIHARYR